MSAPTGARTRGWVPAALGAGLGALVGLAAARAELASAAALVEREGWLDQGLFRLTARALAPPLRVAAVGAGAGLLVGALLGALTPGAWTRGRAARLGGRLAALLAAVTALAAGGAALLEQRRPPDGAPHVVWIVIDSLRADALGCHGYPRDTSPFLDELAASGVRFERALSQESYTLASAASYLTSTYPTTHQVLYDLPEMDTLAPGSRTLAEQLCDAGWSTGAFVFNPHLLARHRFDQGFDVYDDRPHAEGVDGDTPAWLAYETAAFMQRKVLAFLDAAPADRPRFLYLHYRDVHGPYVPPPEYATRFIPDDWPAAAARRAVRDALRPAAEAPPRVELVDYHRTQYDASLAYTDDKLRELFTELARRGIDRTNTLWVITSDHGEEFHDPHPGDAPSYSHGRTLYAEQIHVPLILVLPGEQTPRVVTEPVELLDLAPTTLDVAGLAVPPEFAGRSLLPLVRGEARARRPLFSGGSRARGAVLLDGRVYMEDDAIDRSRRRFNARPTPGEDARPRAELYDLRADPRQTDDLVGEVPDEARRLAALLDAWRARTGDAPPTAALDDDTREQLRALGYLGEER